MQRFDHLRDFHIITRFGKLRHACIAVLIAMHAGFIHGLQHHAKALLASWT